MNKRFAKGVLFVLAVAVVYFGGFIYDEIGPFLYALVLTLIASTPLLLKLSFWKKLLFMFPLLLLRVIGKIFIIVFGRNALSRLLARYGLLERRFNSTLSALLQTKDQAVSRWQRLSRTSQAYLLLIFLPVGIVLVLLTLLIKIVRLRFIQFFIEKVVEKILLRWTIRFKWNPLRKLPGKDTQKSKNSDSNS